MSNISKIDSNFEVKTKLNKSDIKFYDVRHEPFKLYGVFYEFSRFRRLNDDFAWSVNEGVGYLASNSAGGRVRFKTDSPYIAIHTKMHNIDKMPHFTLCGSAGFDMYVFDGVEKYVNTFVPPQSMEDGYESVINFNSSEMREITINLPLYADVSEIYIGLSETATVLPPNPYKIEKPIVYYGSSITQGGCASRPGNSYESMISRRLNADYINLGFSGSARGEDRIAEYISKLDMSAFVYDYDHNAPSVDHLRNTHEKMFKKVREANPKLPIIIMSRPVYYLTEDEKARLEVIRTTYLNAVENGDGNVYFLDGRTLMELAGNDGTVDNCHPNDLGFSSMAKAVGDVLERVLL